MLIECVLVRISSPKAVLVAELSWISLVMDLNQCSIMTQVPMGDAVFMPPRKTGIPSSRQKLVLADFLTNIQMAAGSLYNLNQIKTKQIKIKIYILAFLVRRM
jgi:hypothetical protein